MSASSRAIDEMHLEWLRLADAGVPRAEIADRFGKTRKSVTNLISAVRADLAASEGAA